MRVFQQKVKPHKPLQNTDLRHVVCSPPPPPPLNALPTTSPPTSFMVWFGKSAVITPMSTVTHRVDT